MQLHMLYNVRTPVVYHDCNGMVIPGQCWNNVCGPIATTRDWAIQPRPTNTNGWIALQLLRHNTTPVQRPGVFSDARCGCCQAKRRQRIGSRMQSSNWVPRFELPATRRTSNDIGSESTLPHPCPLLTVSRT